MPSRIEADQAKRLILKNNTITEDPRLDRIEEFDSLSLDYKVLNLLKPGQLENPRSYTWRVSTTLDQGFSGSCVGFCWAHDLLSRPVEILGITSRYAQEVIYWGAQKRDKYPGGSYPGAHPIAFGTSVLAGAKVIKDLGYIEEYRWATSRQELVAAIAYKGPVVLGCKWFERMRKPDQTGFVEATGRPIGRHCILLYSVKIRKLSNGAIDEANSFIRLQNSFGPDWGNRGCAKINLEAFSPLLDGADMCVPIGRKRPILT
jgi:hypothetical protein